MQKNLTKKALCLTWTLLSAALPFAGQAQTQPVPTLYGSVIFGTGWQDMYDAPYGIYAIENGDAAHPKAVKIAPELFANGGGVYVDGKYHMVNHVTYADGVGVVLRTYDVEAGWKLLREQYLDHTGCIATDLAYDPTADRIYGCFGRGTVEGSKTYLLGVLDEFTGDVTEIGALSEQLLTLACNRDGELYGIGVYGNLYRVDKASAALTAVGSTGKNIKYEQSATFDYETGRLFWVATPHGTDNPVYLYEVSTADGSTTNLGEVKDRYEFTGLFTTSPFTDAAAPGRVPEFLPFFEGGATEGTLRFTAPTSTFGGTPLSGELTWQLRVGKEVEHSGTCQPGAPVTVSVALTPGAHLAKVFFSNGSGRGPVAERELWIGNDVARAGSVNATVGEDGCVSLTWEPAQGIHGGYIDSEGVTYRVWRHPDETLIYEGTATSCTEATAVQSYGVYNYEVQTYCNGVKGESVSSKDLVLGQAASLPYNETFTTANSLRAFTILDQNADGTTWFYDGGSVSYAYNEDGHDADDWLLTPPFRLKPDAVYEVSFDAWGAEGSKERFSVALGGAPTAAAMTQTLMEQQLVTTGVSRRYSQLFRPTISEGLSFIGVHAESLYANSYTLSLDNFSLQFKAFVQAPQAVADLQAVAAAEGALSADISFTLPTQSIEGTPLESLNEVDVFRGKTLVAALTDCTPGQAIRVTDTPTLPGNYTYSVVALNDFDEGLYAETTVYVGEDVPGAVENLRLSDLGDGKVRLEWTAPQLGTHGGYINPANLRYEVTDAAGSTVTVTETSHETTVEVPANSQQMTWFSLRSRSNRGRGPVVASDTIFLGPALPLPFHESFSRRGLDNSPWDIEESDYAEWSIMGYGSYTDPQDGDGGMAGFINGSEDTGCRLVSPKFTLSGTHPTLRFWMYHDSRCRNELSVVLSDSHGGRHQLARLRAQDVPGGGEGAAWVCHTYGLEDYAGLGDVQLRFLAEGHWSDALMNVFYLDNISVWDWMDYDLSVGTPVAEETKSQVGRTNRFSVPISNLGSHTAEGYKVILRRGEREVCRVKGPALPADSTCVVELTDRPNADADETSYYSVEVLWNSDQVPANNHTAPMAVTILPGLPFVEGVTARIEGEACVLTWEEPMVSGEGVEAETLTEDFESYSAFTISNLGRWTLYDGDGRPTTGIQDGHGNYVEYDNVGDPMAFQVFNAARAGLSTTLWGAHSGNQVLATFTCGYYGTNDDWLISPEIDGAQTVKFWAKSPNNSYYGTSEVIQVLYSEKGTDVADFVQVGSNITVPGGWMEYSFNVPADAKHFAIRCISADQYVLFLDDITYRRAGSGLRLLGYNVYRDGELLTPEPLAEPTFSDPALPEGFHDYTVTAVYSTGESVPSVAVSASLTGIHSTTAAPAVRVRPGRGSLTVESNGRPYTVTDLGGRLLYRSDRDARLRLPAGVYIVAGQKVTVSY